ncbi:MAG: hypothetical protein PHQ12_03070 [Chthoniobacteraceae bacterium]|nr:hypothetical protein [Chthoniobacteraceae bacterium]
MKPYENAPSTVCSQNLLHEIRQGSRWREGSLAKLEAKGNAKLPLNKTKKRHLVNGAFPLGPLTKKSDAKKNSTRRKADGAFPSFPISGICLARKKEINPKD